MFLAIPSSQKPKLIHLNVNSDNDKKIPTVFDQNSTYD